MQNHKPDSPMQESLVQAHNLLDLRIPHIPNICRGNYRCHRLNLSINKISVLKSTTSCRNRNHGRDVSKLFCLAVKHNVDNN